jgi:hypothetical protein
MADVSTATGNKAKPRQEPATQNVAVDEHAPVDEYDEIT